MLDVIKMGNPTLREISTSLLAEEINTEEIQTLIDGMIEAMKAEHGAGIAAPQVDVLKRIFIMESINNPRYPDNDSFAQTIVINPTIIPISEEKVASWEGCLSIPKIRGQLPRYKKVTLSGLDRTGVAFTKDLEGFEAIVAQHELDHLDGILFIDRMEDMKSLCFLEEYLKFNL